MLANTGMITNTVAQNHPHTLSVSHQRHSKARTDIEARILGPRDTHVNRFETKPKGTHTQTQRHTPTQTKAETDKSLGTWRKLRKRERSDNLWNYPNILSAM